MTLTFIGSIILVSLVFSSALASSGGSAALGTATVIILVSFSIIPILILLGVIRGLIPFAAVVPSFVLSFFGILITVFFVVGAQNVIEPTVEAILPDDPFATNATTISGTRIDLSWESAGSGTSGYSIQRESPVGGGFSTIVANNGNITTYSNTALAIGTQYNYLISSLDGTGHVTGLSSATATTWNIPSAPTGFSADPINSTAVILSWPVPNSNGGNAITGYKIQRQNACTGSFSTIVANTGNTLTTYTNTGLATNTCYNYQVAAINSVGTGPYSNMDSATTASPPPILPPVPTGLSATTKTTANIFLAWTAPSGPITGYKVEKELGTNGGFGTITLNTGNTTTHYTVTALTSGTQYTFRVFTVNGSGTGNSSGTANNYTKTLAPTSLTAIPNGTALKINLSWIAPSGTVTGYKITRNATTLVANTGNTLTTYSNSGLTNNTAYNYTVAAINLGGTSATSNTATANVINSTSSLRLDIFGVLQFCGQEAGRQSFILNGNPNTQSGVKLTSGGAVVQRTQGALTYWDGKISTSVTPNGFRINLTPLLSAGTPVDWTVAEQQGYQVVSQDIDEYEQSGYFRLNNVTDSSQHMSYKNGGPHTSSAPQQAGSFGMNINFNGQYGSGIGSRGSDAEIEFTFPQYVFLYDNPTLNTGTITGKWIGIKVVSKHVPIPWAGLCTSGNPCQGQLYQSYIDLDGINTTSGKPFNHWHFLASHLNDGTESGQYNGHKSTWGKQQYQFRNNAVGNTDFAFVSVHDIDPTTCQNVPTS